MKVRQYLAESKENQIKGEKYLSDLKSSVDLVSEKFKQYEEDRKRNEEVLKALLGKVTSLHQKLENAHLAIDKQEQYNKTG